MESRRDLVPLPSCSPLRSARCGSRANSRRRRSQRRVLRRGIVVPAVDSSIGSTASHTPPLLARRSRTAQQFDASATALASLTASAELDQRACPGLVTASSTAKACATRSPPAWYRRYGCRAGGERGDSVYGAIATTMATVGEGRTGARGPVVNVLTAQRALTTQRVWPAAPDYVDSVALRKQGRESGGRGSGSDRSARSADAPGERGELPRQPSPGVNVETPRSAKP